MDILNRNKKSLFLIGSFTVCLCLMVSPGAAGWAWFTVSSDPSGSWACLDGYNCDNTPITFAVQDSTWHTITVYRDGYQMWSSTEGAGSSGTTTYVHASISPEAPALGYLAINPFGADIYIDGIYYGNGEQTLTLPPGTYTLVVKKAGYYDQTDKFTITAGETTHENLGMTPYPSNVSYGDIQVQSTPSGAAVYLDGDYKGTTYAGSPLEITQIAPGTYTVQLMMPDYLTYTQTVNVQAGVITSVPATMVPQVATNPDTTGQISVISVPAGSNIYLDNVYMGVAPAVLANITSGTHTLTLRETGYQDWISTVNVVGGSYTPVTGTLIPSSPASGTASAQATRTGISPLIVLAGVGICGAFFALRRRKE